MPPAPMRSLTAAGRPATSFDMATVVAASVEDPPRWWMSVSKPNAVGAFLVDAFLSRDAKERCGDLRVDDEG